MRSIARPALAGLIFLGGAAVAGQGLAVLDGIEPGEWRLREIGSRDPGHAMCVRQASALLQVQHARAGNCARFTVSSGPRTATVHYTCPGAGSGRTTITIESASVLRVETQGIADGAPFNVDYEARRTGACGRPG